VLPQPQHSGNCAGPIDVEVTVVGDGILKLEVLFDMWRLGFAIDVQSPTGAARDLATTVAGITGADADRVLSAVVMAIAQPSEPLESAA
jgi:hypothetical protein